MISKGLPDYHEMKNKETPNRLWEGGHKHNGKNELNEDDPLGPLGHLLDRYGFRIWEAFGIKLNGKKHENERAA